MSLIPTIEKTVARQRRARWKLSAAHRPPEEEIRPFYRRIIGDEPPARPPGHAASRLPPSIRSKPLPRPTLRRFASIRNSPNSSKSLPTRCP